MDKLLTISVAAYNVEKTLEKTLSSLNDSRFLDAIEVFVVDDGSKDGTRDIALRYQQVAPDTFHCISKENVGYGSTYNKSMELATGKYFHVLDGDDWVDTDCFAEFIDLLRQTDADLVVTSYRVRRMDTGKETIPRLVTGLEESRIYTWDEISGVSVIWQSMISIKTELLRKHKVHITDECYYVDLEFNSWCEYLAKTIQYFDVPYHVYRLNTGSQSVSRENMLKNIAMYERISRNVVEMYERFCAEGLSGMQRQMVFRQVDQSVGTMYRTCLLKSTVRDSRESILALEDKLRSASEQVFYELSSKTFYKVLRFGDYSLIPVLRVLYRIYVMKRR